MTVVREHWRTPGYATLIGGCVLWWATVALTFASGSIQDPAPGTARPAIRVQPGAGKSEIRALELPDVVPETDKAGMPRSAGSGMDLGAFEYRATEREPGAP